MLPDQFLHLLPFMLPLFLSLFPVSSCPGVLAWLMRPLQDGRLMMCMSVPTGFPLCFCGLVTAAHAYADVGDVGDVFSPALRPLLLVHTRHAWNSPSASKATLVAVCSSGCLSAMLDRR